MPLVPTTTEPWSASEQKIVQALARLMDERLLTMRKILEDRLAERIDKRFTALREEIEFQLMDLDDDEDEPDD